MDTDLKTLAEQIREEHQRASAHRAKAARIEAIAAKRNGRHREHATRCGELLLEAKNEFGRHGQWLPWLKANVPDLPVRTAQHYMGLARGNFLPPKNAKLAFLKFDQKARAKVWLMAKRRAVDASDSLRCLSDFAEDIDWDEAVRLIDTATNVEGVRLFHGRIRRFRDLLDELDRKLQSRVDVLEADRTKTPKAA